MAFNGTSGWESPTTSTILLIFDRCHNILISLKLNIKFYLQSKAEGNWELLYYFLGFKRVAEAVAEQFCPPK